MNSRNSEILARLWEKITEISPKISSTLRGDMSDRVERIIQVLSELDPLVLSLWEDELSIEWRHQVKNIAQMLIGHAGTKLTEEIIILLEAQIKKDVKKIEKIWQIQIA